MRRLSFGIFNSRKILRIIDFSKQCDESLICSVGNLAFSPDGQTLAVSISLRWMEKNGNKIISLDPLSGEIIRQFDDFFKVSFNEDGDYFAAGSENEVKIIDVSTGKEIRSLSMGSDHFSFSLESDLLIEDSLNMLRVWDIENGVVVAKLGPLRYQGSYVISPDGKWVLLADGQCNKGRCTVNIWDMEKHLP